MLLFKKPFWAGLQDGSITLTFRRWERPKVRPGGRYRCHPIGVLEVEAIDRVAVGAIGPEEARQAGFPSLAALRAYLDEAPAGVARPPVDDATEVFRVRLHHGGDGDRVPAALDDRLGPTDVAALRAQLKALDQRSEAGPWTQKALRLIEEHPRVAASQLAARIGWETAPFKANVVKLKKLGLTQSFEVGYELSPRGRAFRAATRTGGKGKAAGRLSATAPRSARGGRPRRPA